ncbi:MAG: N-acetylmuramoyl-L-alanine amidase [Prevotella sp.]|nr:N-acetylmuramoyl-L-alanine amidase [Prevotella sp.]
MFRRLLFILSAMLMLVVLHTGAANRFTLVIDAGHGGRDAGCVGAISKEKDLTLKYALAFGKMVERNCPDVKVVYTRKTDRFLELWQRAEIANRNKADLFISIHINALPNKKIARGVQTYTLGRGETTGKKGIQENLEVAKRENSVIYMEDNYKQTYKGFDPNSPESNIMFEIIQDKNMERSIELARFMQRNICSATGRNDMGAHQNNLAVLRLTSMPGCLLELGYISTPDEERFLNSQDAYTKYARGILNAFIKYKNKYFDNVPVKYKIEDVPVPKSDVESVSEEPPVVPAAKAKRESSQKEAAQRETPQRDNATAKPAQKPATSTNTTKPTTSTGAKNSAGNQPVFKVQIMAGSAKLGPNDRQFKGVSGVERIEDGDHYIYTVGSSTNYNEIYRLRKQLLDKFPASHIVAFKDGSKMDINEAIKEFKAKR